MNEQEFATKIRTKYPGAYDNLSDTELTQKVIAKYPVYASQVKNQPEAKGVVGTLLKPTMEGVQGLKTLYGGGDQGIANKLLSDVQQGASDIAKGTAQGGFEGAGTVIKGVAKAGLRTAGDVAGAIYAPVGAAIGATGIGKVFDYLGELSQKGGKYNPINLITDSKMVQDFVTARPNLEEDFGRALNLAFAAADAGKIDPKTIVERTIKQVENVPSQVKNVAVKTINPIKSVLTKTPEEIVNKRVTELENISGNYAQLRKETNFNPERAKESVKRVASTDVLANAVDENGLIRTKQEGGAVDQYKAQTLDHAENVVRKNLERLGETVSLDEVQTRLEDAVNNSGLEGADLKVALGKVKKEISGYKLKAGPDGNIPLTLVHDAKIATTKKIRDFTTPSEIKTYEKAIGEGLKTTVEKNSSFNVKEVNSELAKYLQDIKFLEQLDGKRVKGGKLGKYFAQISGNIIGGVAGSAIGGPIGSAVGTVVGGELASKIKGSSLQKTLNGKTGNVTLKNPIIQGAIDKVKGNNVTNRINQSNNLGNRNAQYNPAPKISKNVTINQNNTTKISNKTAPATKTSSRIIDNTITQNFKTSKDFVDKWNYINNKVNNYAGGDSAIFGKNITPEEISFRNKILKYLQTPEVEKMYQQGMKDNQILNDLWNNSQKKGIIQRAVDKFKNTPNKQGGFVAIGGKDNFQTKVSGYVTARVHPEDIQYIVDNMARLKQEVPLSGNADVRWENFIQKLGIDKTKSAATQVVELQKLLNGSRNIPSFLNKDKPYIQNLKTGKFESKKKT